MSTNGAAESALILATEGNYVSLVLRLRNGNVKLTMRERRFIADVLEKKARANYSKARKRHARSDAVSIVLHVRNLSGKLDAAVLEAAEAFKCSERKVWDAIGEHRDLLDEPAIAEDD
jgi:hypothetical protein